VKPIKFGPLTRQEFMSGIRHAKEPGKNGGLTRERMDKVKRLLEVSNTRVGAKTLFYGDCF